MADAQGRPGFFLPLEVQLPEDEFDELADKKLREGLSLDHAAWLIAWNSLGHMVVTDDAVGMVRYGHYLGWFAHEQAEREADSNG